MDSAIYPYPLIECANELAAKLLADGTAWHCSVCSKRFNAARKPKSVSRTTHICPDQSVNSFSYLICRKCSREAKQPGNTSHENLFNQAAQSAVLLMAKPKGKS